MNTYNIAFGGTSEQKIGYLKEVLAELNIDAVVEPIPVESGISEQPLSSQETKTGSLNRAINALERSSEADFAIGMEVGYEKNNEGDFEIFCWTSIVNNGLRISSRSHSFLLPQFHQGILNKGLNLGDYVREYINDNDDPINLPQYQKAPPSKTGMNGSLLGAFGTGFQPKRERYPGLKARVVLQIGEDIRGRKPFITNAVRSCLLLFLEKNA